MPICRGFKTSSEFRIPKSWTLYGCNDGNEPERNWEVIHTVMDDGELVRNGDSRLTRGYYHLDAPSKPYKYFKIVFTEVCSGGDLQLAELVLYYPHEKVMTNRLEPQCSHLQAVILIRVLC